MNDDEDSTENDDEEQSGDEQTPKVILSVRKALDEQEAVLGLTSALTQVRLWVAEKTRKSIAEAKTQGASVERLEKDQRIRHLRAIAGLMDVAENLAATEVTHVQEALTWAGKFLERTEEYVPELSFPERNVLVRKTYEQILEDMDLFCVLLNSMQLEEEPSSEPVESEKEGETLLEKQLRLLGNEKRNLQRRIAYLEREKERRARALHERWRAARTRLRAEREKLWKLTEAVDTGKEKRWVRCEEQLNGDVVELYRLDTGEFVRSRPVTPKDIEACLAFNSEGETGPTSRNDELSPDESTAANKAMSEEEREVRAWIRAAAIDIKMNGDRFFPPGKGEVPDEDSSEKEDVAPLLLFARLPESGRKRRALDILKTALRSLGLTGTEACAWTDHIRKRIDSEDSATLLH